MANKQVLIKGARYKIEYEIPGEPPKRTQIVTYLGPTHRTFSAERGQEIARWFSLEPLGGDLALLPAWITKVTFIPIR